MTGEEAHRLLAAHRAEAFETIRSIEAQLAELRAQVDKLQKTLEMMDYFEKRDRFRAVGEW